MGSQLDKPRLFLVATNRVHVNIAVIINAIVSYILVFMYLLEIKLLLTHWGRVTHICVGKLTIIGSDNGLSPGRCQAIIWTNAGILLIEPKGTNFSEILIGIEIFSFKEMRLKMSSAKWRPFCLGLNALNLVWCWYLWLHWWGQSRLGTFQNHAVKAPASDHPWCIASRWWSCRDK